MKKFIIACYRIGCWLVMPVYLLCALSCFLPASFCFFTDALALAFPFLLLALLIVIITAAFSNRRLALMATITLLIGFTNIRNTIAMHPFTAATAPVRDSSTLRVLTWNVFFFLNDHLIVNDTAGNKRRQMIDAIVKEDADVLCMQEYLSYQNGRGVVSVQHILDSLGYKYRIFSNDHVNKVFGGTSDIGAILYSRLPIIDSGRFSLESSPDHAVYADIAVNGKKVRVFTAHLASLGLYTDTAHTGLGSENVYELSYKRKGSIARKIKKTALQHEQQAGLLAASFAKSPYPVIFCGDINSTPATYTYRKLRGQMQDAYLTNGFGLGQTYDALSPTLRIDVCFASSELKITHCEVKHLHLSDHFPVVTTFAVTK